jgi:hypothetical protein
MQDPSGSVHVAQKLIMSLVEGEVLRRAVEVSIVTNGLEYLPGVLNALWQVKWSRMQSRTVADIERAIEALTPQQREALHVWFDARFSNRETQTPTAVEPNPGSVVAQLRTLRARIPSDPEGWTTRDNVN